MNKIELIMGYYVIINFIGFTLMGVDKYRAIKHQWRISERTLYWVTLLGGALGVLVSMNLFRHKTKHLKFKYGVPIILLAQFIGIYYLFFK
jgi:uncharacterized membrane protein YsdA (DUF1294 family)